MAGRCSKQRFTGVITLPTTFSRAKAAVTASLCDHVGEPEARALAPAIWLDLGSSHRDLSQYIHDVSAITTILHLLCHVAVVANRESLAATRSSGT